MDAKEYLREVFASAETKASEVIGAQGRYERLVRALGKIGTQVRFMTVTEDDESRNPRRCFIKAFHEYIFPTQLDTIPWQDESVEYESESQTQIKKEMKQVLFKPKTVRGHINVEYEDADRIHFHVYPEIGNSQVPDEAQRSIDEAFDGYQ